MLIISDVPSTELLSQLDAVASGYRAPIPPPFSPSPQNDSFIIAAFFSCIRQTNVRLRLNNNIIIIKRRPRECISPPSKCVTSIPVKSVALSFRAAFNAKKITGVRDPGDAPFRNFLRSYVGTVPGSTFAKFEVRSFNHFGAHCPCSQLQWPSSCYVVRQ